MITSWLHLPLFKIYVQDLFKKMFIIIISRKSTLYICNPVQRSMVPDLIYIFPADINAGIS